VTTLELVEAHLESVEHALQRTRHECVRVLVLDCRNVGAEVVDSIWQPRHRLDLREQGARSSNPFDVRFEPEDDLHEQRDGLDAQPDDDPEHDVVVAADERDEAGENREQRPDNRDGFEEWPQPTTVHGPQRSAANLPAVEKKETEELRFGGKLLHRAEDAINVGIAALLVAGGGVLLFEAARIGITGLTNDVVLAMTDMLDTILLVFIFAELLYAVRTVITERTITAEPFLLVGIIASIKEILVLAIKAAELLDEGPNFARAATEIGILGGLVLLLAASTWILRRKEREPEE
jgi:uncharacterized membrane protein (DUF373 family)